MAHTDTDRTGHDKWLIYCPRITPDTLLHLSIQGTSCALRDYTDRLTSGPYASGAGHPFKARDDAGNLLTTTAEFKRNVDFDWKVDVYDQGAALTKRTAGATSSPATTSGSASHLMARTRDDR